MADFSNLGTVIDSLVVTLKLDTTQFTKALQGAVLQAQAAGGQIREALAGKFGAGAAAGVSTGDAITAALTVPMIAAAAQAQKTNREIRTMLVETTAAARTAGKAIADATTRRAQLEHTQASWDKTEATLGKANSGMTDEEWRAAYDARRAERARQAIPTEEEIAAARARTAGLSGGASAAGEGAAFGAGASFWEKLFGGKNGARMAGNAARGAMGGAGLGGFAGTAGAAAEGAVVSGGMTAALSAIAALATPLGAVAVALTAIAAIFVAANWDKFKGIGDAIAEVWDERVGPALTRLKEAWDNLMQAFRVGDEETKAWTEGFRIMGEIAANIVASIIDLITGLINIFADVVKLIRALIYGDWDNVWKAAGAIIVHFAQMVGSVIDNMVDSVLSLLGAFSLDAEKNLKALYGAAKLWLVDKFKEIVDGVIKITKDVSQAFFKMMDDVVGHSYVPDMVEGIGDCFKQLPDLMVDPALDATSKVSDAFKQLAVSIGQSMAQGLEAIVFEGAKMKDVAGSLLQQLGRGIFNAGVTQPLGDWLSGVFGGGKGKASNNNGGLFSAIGGIFSGSKSLGSLFGGFFADGGTLKPGQWGIVGERGPEIIQGGMYGANITPMSANGNAPTVVQNIHINPSVEQAAIEQVLKMTPAIRAAAIEGVFEAQARGMGR